MSDIQNFEHGFEAIASIVPKVFAAFRDFANSAEVQSAMRIAHRNLICEKAGWLLHYTTPIDLITDDMTADDVGVVLERYYSENWPEVEAKFRRELESSDVDDEAKATMDEALQAHRAGLYRCSVRAVFPEIERQARVQLHEGKISGLASLRDVRKAIGRLGWSELRDARNGPVFVQFSTMVHHLYAKADTPESLAKFAASPIPNRHAVIHGHISYGSLQSSLGALIMAEFMFKMINFIRVRYSTPEASNPA